MAYGSSEEYGKYLDFKNGECGSKCTCCPPGLVAVYDMTGNHVACLTPADADEYNANNIHCPQGYVALYKEGETPEFRGCVTPTDFETLYPIINPSA